MGDRADLGEQLVRPVVNASGDENRNAVRKGAELGQQVSDLVVLGVDDIAEVL